MPIVSNTSPLLYLAIIDHLFLLPQQFGQLLTPQAVLVLNLAFLSRPPAPTKSACSAVMSSTAALATWARWSSIGDNPLDSLIGR